MAIDSRMFVQLQLEALSVRYFIAKYDELESKVKGMFSSNITLISDKNKQLLYFYLAGLKNTYIDYGTTSLKTMDAKYSDAETFAQFSLSQIIKIQRRNNLLELFNFTIPSLNRKTSEYTFTDCCIKLINMRNKLAHEISHLSFSDKDIIELLSNDYIRNNSTSLFGSLDIELMNDETKSIFSNFVMMDQAIGLLSKQGVSNDH